MWQSLHDAWWRLATTHPSSLAEHLLSSFLQGSAFLYQSGVGARNTAYDRGWIRQAQLPCPVISVGNLTVGGTGKTSCAELLATKLRGLGKRVAILSRGYGGRLPQPYWLLHKDGQLLVNGQPAAVRNGVADEPHVLASHLAEVPIVVGVRRERTGRQACEQFHADVLILDDGFQYRRLHRDLEVVLVNARMPLGGWPLFPRGPMREPMASLKRASVVIVTKADQSLEMLAAMEERLRTFNPTAVMVAAVHEPIGIVDGSTGEAVPLDRLGTARVHLLSSIGDPEGFERTVRQVGGTVLSHAAFPDHHRYRPGEYEGILRQASAAGVEALVTTEKDAIRLRQSGAESGRRDLPLWVLRVRMSLLRGEELLDGRLAGVCPR